MTTHRLVGHRPARDALARAVAANRLPQVLLLVGEPGVGKQRLALWLAQLTLCTARGTEPCGACRACRLVLNLAHPDLHWFVPVPRPKASDPDKQVEEVRETLAAVMTERRERSAYGRPDGMAMHGVACARLLLRIASLTSVEGGSRLFVIGDADRLVPQEANPEAANSLLKFLEEPPPNAYVLLTTTDLTRVLPTIRSRAVPLRVGRLSDAEVREGLSLLAPELSDIERARRAAGAGGSLGRALVDPTNAAGHEAVDQLLAAAKDGAAARFERVLRQPAWQARGDFTQLLDGLAEALGGAARASATGQPGAEVPRTLQDVRDAGRLMRALERVDAARESAQGNLNPQLLLATLTDDLAEALWR